MLIQSLIWFEWLTGWELWRHGDDACTPPRFSRWYFNFSTTNNPYCPALDTTALQPGGVQEDLLYFGAKLLNPSTIFSTHLNI
jgi:hypothetical protein